MRAEQSFLSDLLDVYRKNKRRINRRLHLGLDSHRRGEQRILNFCGDVDGNLDYRCLCMLVFVFSNVLGERMPDHIHARMILGEPNRWVGEYVRYASDLKPRFLFFNPNKNGFYRHTLGHHGNMIGMALK